jgi:hypothetical protein
MHGFAGPRLGTSRRNTLDGPGFFFWTTGFMKDQPITERFRAQFQAHSFNVTNHTNFANPAAAQTQIYSVSGPSLALPVRSPLSRLLDVNFSSHSS